MKVKAMFKLLTISICLILLTGLPKLASAQDSNDLSGVFDQFLEEDMATPDDQDLTAPSDAIPETGFEQDAFDAYRESVDSQDEIFGIDGGDDNEGSGPTPEDLEAEIRDEAFNAAVNGFLPLRPEEIRRFLEIYDEAKQATNTPIYPHPRQETKVQEISLDPADPPQVIKLATGHVTTITFVDVTGAKWPIFDMAWAGDFEISPPDEGAAIIRVIPMSDYAYGNLSVRMSTLQTPIVFTLQAQREVAHVRYDAIVPEAGPFAKPSIVGSNSAPKSTAGSVEVVSVLDGTPPKGAVTMSAEGADSRTKVYSVGGQIYLRTPHTLISPAWSQSASSGDGMNVYVMKKTPVVLLSEKGKILRVFIKDKESNL